MEVNRAQLSSGLCECLPRTTTAYPSCVNYNGMNLIEEFHFHSMFYSCSTSTKASSFQRFLVATVWVAQVEEFKSVQSECALESNVPRFSILFGLGPENDFHFVPSIEWIIYLLGIRICLSWMNALSLYVFAVQLYVSLTAPSTRVGRDELWLWFAKTLSSHVTESGGCRMRVCSGLEGRASRAVTHL